MTTPLYPSFYRYMETTRHMIFYRLSPTLLFPTRLQLPRVEQISLIDCSPIGTTNILHRRFFPSLQRIHYLSGPPADSMIHTRFGRNVEWIFPMGDYPFYRIMVEAGYGKRDEWIVRNHLASEKIVDGERWFDLYLPSRSIVCGEWYYRQQLAYIWKKHSDSAGVSYPIHKEYPSDFHFLPPKAESVPIYDSRWIYHQECMENVFLRRINSPHG